MCAKYNDLEQAVVDAFMELLDHLSPKDAVLTLEYWIFVKYVEQFEQLNEEQQMEVRKILLSLKLVHV